MDAGILFWKAFCENGESELIDLTTIEASMTDSVVATLPVINPSTYTKTISSPVVVIKSEYRRYHHALKASNEAMPINLLYGWGLIGYWGGVMFLGTLWKVGQWFYYLRFNKSKAKDIEKPNQSSQGELALPKSLAMLRHWILLYIVIPATIGTYHQRLFWWSNIPNRLDSLIVFGFWALSIILGFAGYDTFSGNPTVTSLPEQNWEMLSDRTAILSYACLCWLWMFSGRNNIFLWATGFSFQSFNIFHRHIARICTIYAIVHSIGYTVEWIVYYPKYFKSLKENWFIFGIVATIALSIMLGFSSVFLRQRSYEVFLVIHIVLALVVIVALFIHTSYFGTQYNGYLWPTVAIWCFDRFLRLVRLVYCNFSVFSGKAKTTNASVMYSSASDVIRIDLQPTASSLKGRPGQFYYLYQPYTLRGWENHPFTLGAFTNGFEDSSPNTPEIVKKKVTTTTTAQLSDSSDDAVKLKSYRSSSLSNTLTFWIRPYDGWTKRLRNECIKGGGVCYPKILIEGPYGHTQMLHTYDSITMIMGGTGIACAVPYVQDFLGKSKIAISYTSKIKLVWTVRQPEFVEEVCANDLSAAICDQRIEFEFYCSKKNVPTNISTSVHSSDEVTKQIIIQSGRAPVASLIAESGTEAKLSNSRAAVLVCGPAAMADEARAAVHQALKNGCRTLDYFEEAYGW
ncbi:uncharacterized protein N7483_005710 [Penicillium malachiteum]|uniref:uncharacterized protein n=1 Tax=Penicillium malachiteum TaxID=1324776 RepID=UPI002547A6FF|nr:uncharacterized protein N7483_005710 [Penicillium malachiteum]KAJ5731202.1 hypothetical protein N7483_005710 [Penicillium malachiteum]